MAIKAQREAVLYDHRWFMNATAVKGVVISVSTAGSGLSNDNSLSVAAASASSSGAKPLGVLLDDVVNIDQTRQHINWHKQEVNIGNKVTVLKKGTVTTDRVIAATAGNYAVLASSGYVTNAGDINNHNRLTQPIVGRFLSGLDEHGYATLEIDV